MSVIITETRMTGASAMWAVRGPQWGGRMTRTRPYGWGNNATPAVMEWVGTEEQAGPLLRAMAPYLARGAEVDAIFGSAGGDGVRVEFDPPAPLSAGLVATREAEHAAFAACEAALSATIAEANKIGAAMPGPARDDVWARSAPGREALSLALEAAREARRAAEAADVGAHWARVRALAASSAPIATPVRSFELE